MGDSFIRLHQKLIADDVAARLPYARNKALRDRIVASLQSLLPIPASLRARAVLPLTAVTQAPCLTSPAALVHRGS
jgi:hypothetical protein